MNSNESPEMLPIDTHVVIRGQIVQRHGMGGLAGNQMYVIRLAGDRQSFQTNRINVTKTDAPIENATTVTDDLDTYLELTHEVAKRTEAVAFHRYQQPTEPAFIDQVVDLIDTLHKPVLDYVARLVEADQVVPTKLQPWRYETYDVQRTNEDLMTENKRLHELLQMPFDHQQAGYRDIAQILEPRTVLNTTVNPDHFKDTGGPNDIQISTTPLTPVKRGGPRPGAGRRKAKK